MKYKPGDKFIIEIGEETQKPWDSYYFLPNVRIDSEIAMIKSEVLDQLKKYEGGEKKAEYQRGLADAWEAAYKVLIMKESERYQSFGERFTVEIFTNNTAAEAIAQIREYEEAKKVKVGDELETVCEKFVVTLIRDNNYFGVGKEGALISANKDYCKKTGRHFSEISALLEKLKEAAPDV